MKAEMRLVLVSAIALLALAGCQEKKQAEQSRASAAGEVLPGSASDAMLAADTVRSQPPLAPKSEPSGSKSDKPNGSAKAAPGDDVADEPAAEPPADEPPAEPAAE